MARISQTQAHRANLCCGLFICGVNCSFVWIRFEDRGSTFVQIVSLHLEDYTVSQPKTYNLNRHRHQRIPAVHSARLFKSHWGLLAAMVCFVCLKCYVKENQKLCTPGTTPLTLCCSMVYPELSLHDSAVSLQINVVIVLLSTFRPPTSRFLTTHNS